MKVFPCGTPTPAAEFPLSWADVIENEGIYKARNDCTTCFGYWVVVAGAFGERPTTQFWTDGNTVERLPTHSELNKYRRVEATLCLEVRARP